MAIHANATLDVPAAQAQDFHVAFICRSTHAETVRSIDLIQRLLLLRPLYDRDPSELKSTRRSSPSRRTAKTGSGIVQGAPLTSPLRMSNNP
jgi:hypothetical protein